MSQARYIADFVIQSNNIADGAVTFADVGSLYTSNVTENTSLYFTNARATAAVVAGAAANSILFVSSAGVLANSNTLVWTGSNLGIGTGTPTTRLDVVNASGRAARIGGFQFGGTTTSADGGNNLLSSGVYWNGTNLTATQTTGAVLQLANGALQFQALSGLTAGNTYSYAPQMALDSSGNLGIGTGSPSARLHINGTSDATQRIIVNGTGNFSSYKLNYNGSEVAFIQSYQNTELNFGTTVNAPILFYVNNAEQMRLNTTGLGIGTSSPVAKLDVVSGTNTTLSVPAGVVAKFSGSVVINSLNTGGAGDVDSLYFQKSHGSGINISNYDLGIIRSYTTNGYAGGLDFYTNKHIGGGNYASTFAMRIDDNQNLGIGTTSPDSLYNITIQRKVGSSGNMVLQGDNVTYGLPNILFKNTNGGATAYLGFNGDAITAKAIAFPATQVASSNANTLDDYEEGTWSPVLAAGGSSVSMGTGRYTKVGRLVYCVFDVFGISISGWSGNMSVTGLPFTAQSSAVSQSSYMFPTGANNTPVLFYVETNTTGVVLYKAASSSQSVVNLTPSDFASSTISMRHSFTYIADN